MRSLLLVSAERPETLRTASRAGADALVLNLSRATERRAIIDHRTLLAARTADGDPPPRVYGRVGGFGSDLVGTELDALMPVRPDGILLMDAVGGPDISRLGAMLAVQEAEHGFEDGSTRIVAVVSSARGVLAVGSLVGASRRLAGIAWDADALRADLGATSTTDGSGAYADPFRVARAMILFAAAAAKVPAIDTGCVGEDLAEQCRTAGRDGFSAKLALDPAQVPIINAAFGPKPR